MQTDTLKQRLQLLAYHVGQQNSRGYPPGRESPSEVGVPVPASASLTNLPPNARGPGQVPQQFMSLQGPQQRQPPVLQPAPSQAQQLMPQVMERQSSSGMGSGVMQMQQGAPQQQQQAQPKPSVQQQSPSHQPSHQPQQPQQQQGPGGDYMASMIQHKVTRMKQEHDVGSQQNMLGRMHTQASNSYMGFGMMNGVVDQGDIAPNISQDPFASVPFSEIPELPPLMEPSKDQSQSNFKPMGPGLQMLQQPQQQQMSMGTHDMHMYRAQVLQKQQQLALKKEQEQQQQQQLQQQQQQQFLNPPQSMLQQVQQQQGPAPAHHHMSQMIGQNHYYQKSPQMQQQQQQFMFNPNNYNGMGGMGSMGSIGMLNIGARPAGGGGVEQADGFGMQGQGRGEKRAQPHASLLQPAIANGSIMWKKQKQYVTMSEINPLMGSSNAPATPTAFYQPGVMAGGAEGYGPVLADGSTQSDDFSKAHPMEQFQRQKPMSNVPQQQSQQQPSPRLQPQQGAGGYEEMPRSIAKKRPKVQEIGTKKSEQQQTGR